MNINLFFHKTFFLEFDSFKYYSVKPLHNQFGFVNLTAIQNILHHCLCHIF